MIIQSDESMEPITNDLDGVSIGVFLTYDGMQKRNFRCINCTKLTFQYAGKVALLMESPDKPLNTGHTEHLCTRCRVTYHILW